LSSLQVLAVKLSIQRLDDESRKSLQNILDKIDAYLNGEIEVDGSNLHMEIQDALYGSSKSPKLVEIIQGLYFNVRTFANIGYEVPGRMQESIEEHRDVIVAILTHETEIAEYLTR